MFVDSAALVAESVEGESQNNLSLSEVDSSRICGNHILFVANDYILFDRRSAF
jgi:hypothetical protein